MNYKWFIGGGVVLLLGVYFLYNPAGNPLFPKCPFLQLTQLRCPGCGSQRALHQLLHFNFLEAFRYNALLVSSIPVLSLLYAAQLLCNKYPRFYNKIYSPILIWCLLAIIVFWWLLRNLFGW